MDHLLTLEFSFNFWVFKLVFFKNLILTAERRRQKKATKENVDHLLTLQRAKCGPLIDPTTYIYIYAVKSGIGPSLAIFKVRDWAKSKSGIGPRSFSHYKNRGFGRFCFSQSSLCVFFCSQLLANFLKIAFFKERVHKLGFSIFCVLSLNVENSLFYVC